MIQFAQAPAIPVSPLVLSDRLLSLARAADHAGCRATAVTLLGVAHAVLDETPGCCGLTAPLTHNKGRFSGLYKMRRPGNRRAAGVSRSCETVALRLKDGRRWLPASWRGWHQRYVIGDVILGVVAASG